MKYQLMPKLSDEEYKSLKNDISSRGVLVPIEYDEEGNILDGHHRLMACNELNIKQYPSVIRVGLSEEEKRQHIRMLNLARRHLNQKQRRNLIEEQLKDTPDKSDRQIAGMLGVDHKTVGNIREELKGIGEIPQCPTVQTSDGRRYPRQRKPKSILAPRTHELKKGLLLAGEINNAKLPDHPVTVKRAARIDREDKAQSKTVESEIFIEKNYQIWFGDFREKAKNIADSSIDLIFTDPPYHEEHLPLFRDLGFLAYQKLKPTGRLITYSGALFLPEVHDLLRENLKYWWQGSVIMPGQHSRVHPRSIVQITKPLLFYVTSEFNNSSKWVQDSFISDKMEKGHHDWQQNIEPALYYIEKLTNVGDLVLDPFLGGGTTGIAALKLGRRFIGIDNDAVAFETAKQRLLSE